MKRHILLIVPITSLVLLFIVTGFRGIDFGFHWDEVPMHMGPVRGMVESGVLLPHEYTYPALSKWLILLPALPETLWAVVTKHGDPDSVHAVLKHLYDAPDYLLSARRVFVVVSSLAILWVYGAVLALRRPVWEAIIAACGMGLSWEYAYHSRWIANDCILTQFSALTVFALALFRRDRTDRWLYLAAAAVGFGTGSKQPGIFLFVPVILTSVLTLPLRAVLKQIRRGATLFAIVVGCFVLTTPGVLLEPFTFFGDGQKIAAIYGAGHGQFGAHSAWQHWGWVWTYLSVEFFSPYHAISIATMACAALGLVIWVRRDWRFTVPLLIFPLVFLGIFCAKYVVMICRNYLQFTPILSVLAASGLATIFELLKNRWLRLALGSGLGVIAVAQAVFLIRAGESIRHVDYSAYARQAIAYVAAHPGEKFRVSDHVRKLAAEQQLAMPPNVAKAPEGQAVVMFGRGDMGYPGDYKENNPWLTDAVFGPLDVNFNWYAVWGGNDRIVVMPIEIARAGGVPLAR
ncbi:MAG: glycosyltransferase family 39 protein [Myxococcales bacterium]